MGKARFGRMIVFNQEKYAILRVSSHGIPEPIIMYHISFIA